MREAYFFGFMTREGRSLTLLDSSTPTVLSTKRDELLLRLESFKVNNLTAKESEELKKKQEEFARDFLWTVEYFLGIFQAQVRFLSDDQIKELDKLMFERVNVRLSVFRCFFKPPYISRYRKEKRESAKRGGGDCFNIMAIRLIIGGHRDF